MHCTKGSRRRLVNPRQVFGGALSVVLLGLFIYLLLEAYSIAREVVACGSVMDCADQARARFGPPMQGGLNLIGGLVAAIVIAELAITKPNEIPAARLFSATELASAPGCFPKVATVAYMIVWALSGLAAYVWGTLQHSDALPCLSDYGSAWLGLAVAAGYTYFGVQR
jgi:hypothetical protein